MIAYILFDSALHALIRKEVRSAVKLNEINMHFLVNNCPQLQSVFYEAMRLTKRDIGIRKIVKPTLLGGKLLASGNAVILATCQLHENRDIFNHNVHEFDSNRFLRDLISRGVRASSPLEADEPTVPDESLRCKKSSLSSHCCFIVGTSGSHPLLAKTKCRMASRSFQSQTMAQSHWVSHVRCRVKTYG